MKCCIATDLLPGYIDGLTSPETNEEIESIWKAAMPATPFTGR